MSWDTIVGDAKILPGGSGSVDEVKLESGKPVRVRLLLRDGEQPYSFLEHAVECEAKGADGKIEKMFRTIRCPKTTNNPNASCPICDGQRFRRRVRNAANVWDYEQGKVQKLCAGDGIWKPIATTRKMGVNVLSTDWGLMRTGTDRNDTEYTASNLGPHLANISYDESQLFDIEREYAPHTIEEMQLIIESIGLKWEEVIVPPHLNYPTLQGALEHVMPNGKYKGQTFAQIWQADQSSKGMINYLATKSDRVTDEKAAAQVILVNLGGAQIDGVPRYNSDGSVANMSNATPAPAQTPTPTQAPAQQVHTNPGAGDTKMNNVQMNNIQMNTPAQAPVQQGSPDRTARIDTINNILSSKDKFVKGGFKEIIETMKKAGNGKTNIAEFTDAELTELERLCNE